VRYAFAGRFTNALGVVAQAQSPAGDLDAPAWWRAALPKCSRGAASSPPPGESACLPIANSPWQGWFNKASTVLQPPGPIVA
jgi:hypothetical protein